ncbi:HK97 gp10 family phage protein [Staphylococcus epidermidis]|uniref:HK97-gp10 family putative phage morphogenesis protein n=1 Tax=Staphylococcus TaxID=1279 RepID=UPI0009B2B59A|nr:MULTISPECIES: HK97-gp10 family putative phage morphogenesis protein [Staphylococcus]AYY62118.1 HK97 gp10 family phage protein [Staphylococcus epidermidis]MBM6159270.1 HK97 gp10 family phage protein [Staphylococcus epidermidis]MBM6161415.1 HK97 gp10 family phage protein [Staphylococcus epidermidis]MBM6170394.1 HK97 gp10 family phage protein [Staphylococcus epidermidis]MBM6177048.1 HK97 gp10 family phage protein [Staphylococcus epidermidis]
MAGDIDALIRKLDRMHSSIDDDVDEVLKNNAGEFARDTVVSAKSVMNKGYWTGNLARMIRDTKNGDMKYAITSNAGYSGFLEYGTRYMAPETFMFPVYERYTRKVREDLERLINGKTGGM